MSSVISGSGLVKTFGDFTALDGVDFTVDEGATVGIVGESGSGKSTLGKVLMSLLKPDAGTLHMGETDILALRGRDLRAFRRRMQLVPQDPRTSLNPTMSVGTNLEFQYAAQGVPKARWSALTEELLDTIALPVDYAHAYPHELSGGQVQRIAIARAISGDPDVLVCDEAVSALDKSVQAQVLNTLARLQQQRGLAMFFITHDLSVVEHISDDIVVLNRGRVVESGKTRVVLSDPHDPYTRELLAAREPRHQPPSITVPHTQE